MQSRWDIFCTVVDNFGDIGVTWRLARQLAAEYPYRVRLWVDDLSAFVAICPQASLLAEQVVAGVTVCQWGAWQSEPADVVIEAFGCELPHALVSQMKALSKKPLWLNLEYLSAEAWVEGCHGLPSPQGSGLNKTFFFPGFTDKTGGLLREKSLFADRDAFIANHAEVDTFLKRLGVVPRPDVRRISLFAYEISSLGEWLTALSISTAPTQLLVPNGRVLGNVAKWLGVSDPKPFEVYEKGALSVHIVPFMSQEDYDKLLWCCDMNCVRGEDSFIRAQWAGKPFVWHIYPQDEDAHFVKLDAFLAQFTHDFPEDLAISISGFWHAWNRDQGIAEAWNRLEQLSQVWGEYTAKWLQTQASYPDLAQALAKFYENSL